MKKLPYSPVSPSRRVQRAPSRTAAELASRRRSTSVSSAASSRATSLSSHNGGWCDVELEVCHKDLAPGDGVGVVGDHTALAKWGRGGRALRLQASPQPYWCTTVRLPADRTLSYQYVVTRDGAPRSWESLDGTRTLRTGAPGSRARVRDRALGSRSRARPRVTEAPPRPPPPTHALVERAVLSTAQAAKLVRDALCGRGPIAPTHRADGSIDDREEALFGSLENAAETARELGTVARDAAAALRTARSRVRQRHSRRFFAQGINNRMVYKVRKPRNGPVGQRIAALIGSIGAAGVVALALAVFGDVRIGFVKVPI